MILNNTRLDTSLGNKSLKARQKVQIYIDTFPLSISHFWSLLSYNQMSSPEGTRYSQPITPLRFFTPLLHLIKGLDAPESTTVHPYNPKGQISTFAITLTV